MCEINPKHSLFFRLEAFTSNPNQSKEVFEAYVLEMLMDVEIKLNENGMYRFHIHEEE